jgi:transposase-like protein
MEGIDIATMDWERVGREVDRRIFERGVKIRAVARQAEVDPTTLWRLRRGHGDLLSPQLRTRIEAALAWPPGTIDRIGSDPDYQPPADPPPVDRDRLVAIEQRIADLQEQVVRLARMLEP